MHRDAEILELSEGHHASSAIYLQHTAALSGKCQFSGQSFSIWKPIKFPVKEQIYALREWRKEVFLWCIFTILSTAVDWSTEENPLRTTAQGQSETIHFRDLHQVIAMDCSVQKNHIILNMLLQLKIINSRYEQWKDGKEERGRWQDPEYFLLRNTFTFPILVFLFLQNFFKLMRELCQPEIHLFLLEMSANVKPLVHKAPEEDSRKGFTVLAARCSSQLQPDHPREPHRVSQGDFQTYRHILHITAEKDKVLLLSKSHNATHLPFFSRVFFMQAKNWIQVCKAEATFPFPKMNAGLFS